MQQVGIKRSDSTCHNYAPYNNGQDAQIQTVIFSKQVHQSACNLLDLNYTLYNRLADLLGSGQFGTVYKGVWQSPIRGDIDVAVKTLKEGSKDEDRVKFLQEAAIMGQFQHPNVVEMYGVVTQGEPVSGFQQKGGYFP